MDEIIYQYLHGELVSIEVYTCPFGDAWWRDGETIEASEA